MGKFIITTRDDRYEIIKTQSGHYVLTGFGEGEDGVVGGLGKNAEAVKGVLRDICSILETNRFSFTWRGGNDGDDVLEGEE